MHLTRLQPLERLLLPLVLIEDISCQCDRAYKIRSVAESPAAVDIVATVTKATISGCFTRASATFGVSVIVCVVAAGCPLIVSTDNVDVIAMLKLIVSILFRPTLEARQRMPTIGTHC